MKKNIIGLIMVSCMLGACGSDSKNENNEENINNQNLNNNQNNRNTDDGEHRIDVIKFKYVTDDGRELNDVNLYFDNKLEMFVTLFYPNTEEMKLVPETYNHLSKTKYYIDENCVKPMYENHEVYNKEENIFNTYNYLKENKNKDVFKYEENYYYIEKENRVKIDYEENKRFYFKYNNDCSPDVPRLNEDAQYYTISQINSFKMNDFEIINIVKE